MDTDCGLMITRGKQGGEVDKDKGVKYLMMEVNLTLGGEYTRKYIYDLLLNCTLDTHLIFLINVTLIIFNKN